MAKPSKPTGQPAGRLPSKDEILAYLKEHPRDRDKRQLARVFKLRGADRVALRDMLREMRRDGLIEDKGRRRMSTPDHLPSVTVLRVTELDEDGDLLAKPAGSEDDDQAPLIILAKGSARTKAPSQGDLILARLSRQDDGSYRAQIIRVLDHQVRRVLGLYEVGPAGGRLRPCDKKARDDYLLAKENAAGAEPGELVLTELLPKPRGRQLGLRAVKVIERLGGFSAPGAFSLIAIHEQGLPNVFPAQALAEAKAAKAAPLKGREDLRKLPLITIDGADARDFDDAVYAAADDDPANPGGHHVVVAIADVAHYVRPGSALDREARHRGNSTYFPDRVVPMLPEALSNGWCSLVPDEDRSCLGVEMWFDAVGNKTRHRFFRALMRSAARTTYEQVQAIQDKVQDKAVDDASPELRQRVAALYAAFASLNEARDRRGTLDLDLPERQVILDEAGQISDIATRVRHDSHRLIEEFMIAANVAAAEELERRSQPCMYRVHEPPDPEKLAALREVLRGFDLSLPPGQVLRPKQLTALLHKVADHPGAALVNEMVLRSQSQAVYAPDNQGHFGLALRRYAHFTSPIRRYADLLVHRGLISGLGLGNDGLGPDDGAAFEEIGAEISACERRAAVAERSTVDRFCAAFLADRIGEAAAGRIRGVTRFGLFVNLDHSGADGLLLAKDLADDYYRFDEKAQALIGERWGRSYRLGQPIAVKIIEASPISGSIRLSLDEDHESNERDIGEKTTGHHPSRTRGRPGSRTRGRPEGPSPKSKAKKVKVGSKKPRTAKKTKSPAGLRSKRSRSK